MSSRTFVRRLALALVTLWLLATIVFIAAQVLPGNVGRKVLGPFADEESVRQLNHELGTDRPFLTQYIHWLGNLLRGRLGTSLNYDRPVADLLWPAFVHSAKLAALAFLLVVPLSIAGGVVAALRRGKLVDRLITIGGLSAAIVPEFVWAVLLIWIFGVKLQWLPVTGLADDGASILTQYKHLLLPALCLVFVLFGYIARITRAGMIEALDAEYARTAVLKGLPMHTVVTRHVLRNALLPTIAVVATQFGYLMGGLVAIELIFSYPGIGQLLLEAVQKRDVPLLEGAVLVSGAVYVLATLAADVLSTVLNPRLRP